MDQASLNEVTFVGELMSVRFDNFRSVIIFFYVREIPRLVQLLIYHFDFLHVGRQLLHLMVEY